MKKNKNSRIRFETLTSRFSYFSFLFLNLLSPPIVFVSWTSKHFFLTRVLTTNIIILRDSLSWSRFCVLKEIIVFLLQKQLDYEWRRLWPVCDRIGLWCRSDNTHCRKWNRTQNNSSQSIKKIVFSFYNSALSSSSSDDINSKIMQNKSPTIATIRH